MRGHAGKPWGQWPRANAVALPDVVWEIGPSRPDRCRDRQDRWPSSPTSTSNLRRKVLLSTQDAAQGRLNARDRSGQRRNGTKRGLKAADTTVNARIHGGSSRLRPHASGRRGRVRTSWWVWGVVPRLRASGWCMKRWGVSAERRRIRYSCDRRDGSTRRRRHRLADLTTSVIGYQRRARRNRRSGLHRRRIERRYARTGGTSTARREGAREEWGAA